MAHTVTFKLNKPANVINGQDSTGFGIRGGVKFYNRKTKQEEWTNYEAVVFAKAQAQIDYYSGNLVEGAIVSVSGESITVNVFNGNNGPVYTLALNNARIEYLASPPQSAPQQGRQSPQQRQQAQQLPQYAPAGFDDFDDSIPF